MSIIQLIGQTPKIDNIKRKSVKPDFFSDALDWKIYRAARVPGPGAYDTTRNANSMSGGRWGKCKPLSYLELAEMHGKKTPGPGEYNVDEAVRKLDYASGGGKFNMSKSKSYLDWVVHSSKGVPAPNAYNLPSLGDPGGGKFNQSKAKTDVEWQIYRASTLPAPGEYGFVKLPGPAGGKFNTSKTKSDLDWTVLRASKTPGPGAYACEKFGSSLHGGKFNNGNPKSDVEWSIYRASKVPGPGQYELSRATAYLSKNTPKFSFAGRPGPAHMPVPYTSFSSRPITSLAKSMNDITMESSEESELPPSPARSMSPGRPDLTSVKRLKEMEGQHVERMKKAFVRASMKRRQRDMMGFGGSFFL